MQSDFRWVLRDRTSGEHERVDRLLSALDIGSPDGFADFLSIHRICFAAMKADAPAEEGGFATLTEMIACIDSDLASLGIPCDAGSAVSVGPVHVLARDYVLEGSRLGSKVLRRRWEASEDPRVKAADAYFSITPVPGRWREVCAALSAVSPDGPEATRIAEDAGRLFALFHDVAKDWLSEKSGCREVSI